MFNWNSFLFRSRKIVVSLALLLLLYTNIYLWFFIPFSDFDFHWRPDDQLVIYNIPDDSLAAPYLQVGDEITSVDGRSANRAGIVFVGIKSSYEFTVHRGDETVATIVPFSTKPTSIGASYRSPSAILSTIFLLVGAMILFFAKRNNHMAIHVGYIFVGSAVTTMGVQAELLSVPGAWLTRPVWYLPIFLTPYLGFLPRLNPLSPRLKKVFAVLFITAVTLGVVALWEAIFLFPQHTSLQRIIGFSPYELVLLAGGIVWMLVFFILIVRAQKMEQSSYERQQIIILMFFIGLAILPVTLLTLIPRGLFDTVFIPFPVSISLFILVPTGYFFVIYRRGYLSLDIVFSKTIIFLTLALTMVTLYGSGLAIISHQFDLDSNVILPATLLLIPILMLTRYSTPLDDWIQGIFFGPVTRNDSLPKFWSALSSKPELTTLEAIVNSLAEDFNVPYALLSLTSKDGILSPVAKVNIDAWQPEQVESFQTFHKPLLRSSEHPKSDHPFFQTYKWLELLVPIIVRDEQIGFLAMARPKDGFFNTEQVVFMTRAADMIAVGSEAIFLFEAAGKWSLQLLTAREMERQYIASMIHDRPLQNISLATDKVIQVLSNPRAVTPDAAVTLKKQTQTLKTAMNELREICVGLFPPVIEQGLGLVVEEVTEQFENKFGLRIVRQVEIADETVGTTDLSTVIYRVLTESLNNIVKHSQTHNVEIYLQQHNAHLSLEVADDGIGSSLPTLSLSELARQRHVGIRGMIEWAKMVDGHLTIQNNEPQGTKVVLEIPINNNEETIYEG